MSIFFTSDLHFGHKNICKYAGRPFQSVHEMNSILIKNWNSIVSNKDEVYHLGDFSFCSKHQTIDILNSLNGQIHMIFGNHDKVIQDNHEELLSLNLLKSAQFYKEVHHNNKMYILFHYGMRVWNKAHYGSIHLYGHSHGKLPPFGLSMDVGIDSKVITNEYRPYSYEEVLSFMDERKQDTDEKFNVK